MSRGAGRAAIVVILLMVQAVPGVRAAPPSVDVSSDDLADAASPYLSLVWEEVAPGRVIVQPIGVNTDDGPAVLLITENRRARLLDDHGTEIAETRTGIRDVDAALREGADRLLLVPSSPRGRPAVRLSYVEGRLLTVGRPASAQAVLLPDPRAVALDDQGLVYSVDGGGTIAHASAAGGMLWQRSLPARAVDVFRHRGLVVVASADGRLIAFDGAGDATEILRWNAPIEVGVSFAPTPSGDDSRILVVDRDGALTLFHGRGESVVPVEPAWTISRPGPEPADRFDPVILPLVGPSDAAVVVPGPDGGMSALSVAGREVWNIRGPGASFITAIAAPPFRGVVASTDDDRLIPIDSRGVVGPSLVLPRRPARVTWLETTGRLVVEYPDWRVQVFSLEGTVAEDGPDRPRTGTRGGRQVSPGRPPSGLTALDALADSVLSGGSERDRADLLGSLRSRRMEGRLFGRVGAVRRILGALLTETYRAPLVRGTVIANDFPAVRRGAVEELSNYLDVESRRFLADAVRHDPDLAVAAAALEAIARYGVDDVGALSAAVERYERSDGRGRRVLAPALLSHLEDTTIRTTDPRLFERVLSAVVTSDVPREIRRRAADAGREPDRR